MTMHSILAAQMRSMMRHLLRMRKQVYECNNHQRELNCVVKQARNTEEWQLLLYAYELCFQVHLVLIALLTFWSSFHQSTLQLYKYESEHMGREISGGALKIQTYSRNQILNNIFLFLVQQ